MLDPAQFRRVVVRPTLMDLGLYSRAAEALLMGTAMQESGLRYLTQLGGGPALGLYQMEPSTYMDIWRNFLLAPRRRTLADRVREMGGTPDYPGAIAWNLRLATAMCRIHYLRVPDPLPDPDDPTALGWYWKQHYNTPAGRGSVVQFVSHYQTIREGR